MPWNCLCSSDKEKHKLEISAPILNRENECKPKIIPDPRKDSNQQLIEPSFQRNGNHWSTDNYPEVNGKLAITTMSRKIQRSKKNTKESHARPSSGDHQSLRPTAKVKFLTETVDFNSNTSTLARHEPDDEDSTYSQLVFERKVHKPNETSSANVWSPNSTSLPNKQNTPKNRLSPNKDPNLGHYDRLPFEKRPLYGVNGGIKFRVNHHPSSTLTIHTDNLDSRHSHANGTNITSIDTIPFIDEDDIVNIVESHSSGLRIKEDTEAESNSNSGYRYSSTTRIITLHPKNIGSHQTIERGNSQRCIGVTQAINSNKKIGDAPHSLPHLEMTGQTNSTLITRSQAEHQTPTAHDFLSWNPAKGKRCQICHMSALNAMVKCGSCDLVCHLRCVPRIMVERRNLRKLVGVGRGHEGGVRNKFPTRQNSWKRTRFSAMQPKP